MNMTLFAILGFVVLSITVWFWYTETKPWLDNMVIPRSEGNLMLINIDRIRCTIINILRLFTDGKYLLADLAITFIMTTMFGLGGGVVGGIIGAMTSNFISVGIYFRMKQFNKRKVQICRST